MTGSTPPTRMQDLVARLMRMVAAVDPKARAAEAARLLQESGGDADRAAGEAVRRAASTSGKVGVVTALPGLLPGAGTALAIGGAALDMGLAFARERDLAAVLLILYGHDMHTPRGKATLASAVIFGHVRQQVVAMMTAWFAMQTTRLLAETAARVAAASGAKVAVRAGGKLGSRGAARALPLIGVALSGGVSYGMTRAFGESLRRQLRQGEVPGPDGADGGADGADGGADGGGAPGRVVDVEGRVRGDGDAGAR